MMGDRYKAIKQKWEMDYDGCRFFMDYGGYKLKAPYQKKLTGAAMLQSGNKINASLSATGIWQNIFFWKGFAENLV